MSEENRVCPYCRGHKDKLELLCYYSNENIMWSDYRHLLPQVAVPSLVQKCPHCGKYYIIKASHVLIKDTADFEFIDPVSWNYFSKSYEDYSGMKKDDVVDYNHRLRILGAFNDEFRRTKNPPVPTEQDIKIYRDNMLHLMGYFQDPLDRAEMYREMGLFEKCFKQLDMVEDEGDEMKMKYKDTVFDFARQENVSPFWVESGIENFSTSFKSVEFSPRSFFIITYGLPISVAFVRSTAPGEDELWARNRFTAVAAAVKVRRKDLSHIASDMQAFEAQKNTAGGKKTMKAYLWLVCGQEYDQAHPRS